jgi:hypothetical protein
MKIIRKAKTSKGKQKTKKLTFFLVTISKFYKYSYLHPFYLFDYLNKKPSGNKKIQKERKYRKIKCMAIRRIVV